MSPGNCISRRELRACRLSPSIVKVYSLLRMHRHWKWGRVFVKAVMRLEGGPFYSTTGRAILEQFHGVTIGAYSYGNCFTPGAFSPSTTLGRYCSIAQGVLTYTQDHPIERLSSHCFFYNPSSGLVPRDNLPRRNELVIESDVWIGRNVIVATGCRRIGVGSVVGAGAVVTKDVPDLAIVAGNPARVIRYRFEDELRERVLASRWWELPIHEIGRHLDLMTRPLGASAADHPLLSTPAEAACRCGDPACAAGPSR